MFRGRLCWRPLVSWGRWEQGVPALGQWGHLLPSTSRAAFTNEALPDSGGGVFQAYPFGLLLRFRCFAGGVSSSLARVGPVLLRPRI